MPPSESLPSEQAAFSKHLFTQGYPLWSPDPVLLPAVRQSVGLKIGDVGTVDERERFDVFFNILEPPPGISDSLRPNFPPVVENDTRCLDQDLLHREVVSSPETSWEVDQSLEVMMVADMSRRTTQYSATLSVDGAHIILPQGAQLFELPSQHKKLFESHAREHGAEWLELFKDQLGWPRSNSLYLLTGFYKTCSWSLASFGMQRAADTDPVYVYCTLVEIDERTIRQESVWHPAGRFKRKIGPAPDRQGQNNQTVFIRGITITPKHGQTEEPPATSTLFNRLITNIPFLNTLTRMGSTEGSTTQSPGSDVIIQHMPPISQASHPSEVINRYLLKKDPSARIAVTHDSQWISMLEMLGRGRPWTLDELESHLDALVSEHYCIARHNSTVYLRDKERRSSTPITIERSSSNDMPLYSSKIERRHNNVVHHSKSSDDHQSTFGSDNSCDYNVHLDPHGMDSNADDYPNTGPASLKNLALRHSIQYKLLGGMQDLDEAIVLIREALNLQPQGHPDRSMSLNSLAVGLSTRYKQLGGMQDLYEAIVVVREALSLQPQGHPDRSTLLNNLAVGLSTRNKQLGSMQDLDEAIVLARDALTLCPPRHPDRSTSLDNLAVGLSTRYK